MKDSKRRINAIALARRVNELACERYKAMLNRLHAHLQEIEDEIAALNALKDEEGHICSPDSAPYLANFLSSIENRKRFLTREAETHRASIVEVREKLRLAFLEVKSAEAAIRNIQDQVQIAERRRELANADEVAQTVFLRHSLKVPEKRSVS